EIDAVYVLQTNDLVPPESCEDPFLRQEVKSVLGTVLRSIPARARWFDPLSTCEMHLYKPLQLDAARAVGLSVPDAIISTDPRDVRDFCDRHGSVVIKPCAGFAYARALTTVTPEDIAQICAFPVMLEERVPGIDVLAYVIDGQVFAAEIAGS